MRSKLLTVDSRCAMAITVRPCISRPDASRIASSDSLSSANVAWSRRRSGAFLRNARAWRCAGAGRVDQKLDAVLRAHRTGDGAQDRGEDGRVRQRALPHVTQDKGNGTAGLIAKLGHAPELQLRLVTGDAPAL